MLTGIEQYEGSVDCITFRKSMFKLYRESFINVMKDNYENTEWHKKAVSKINALDDPWSLDSYWGNIKSILKSNDWTEKAALANKNNKFIHSQAFKKIVRFILSKFCCDGYNKYEIDPEKEAKWFSENWNKSFSFDDIVDKVVDAFTNDIISVNSMIPRDVIKDSINKILLKNKDENKDKTLSVSEEELDNIVKQMLNTDEVKSLKENILKIDLNTAKFGPDLDVKDTKEPKVFLLPESKKESKFIKEDDTVIDVSPVVETVKVINDRLDVKEIKMLTKDIINSQFDDKDLDSFKSIVDTNIDSLVKDTILPLINFESYNDSNLESKSDQIMYILEMSEEYDKLIDKICKSLNKDNKRKENKKEPKMKEEKMKETKQEQPQVVAKEKKEEFPILLEQAKGIQLGLNHGIGGVTNIIKKLYKPSSFKPAKSVGYDNNGKEYYKIELFRNDEGKNVILTTRELNSYQADLLIYGLQSLFEFNGVHNVSSMVFGINSLEYCTIEGTDEYLVAMLRLFQVLVTTRDENDISMKQDGTFYINGVKDDFMTYLMRFMKFSTTTIFCNSGLGEENYKIIEDVIENSGVRELTMIMFNCLLNYPHTIVAALDNLTKQVMHNITSQDKIQLPQFMSGIQLITDPGYLNHPKFVQLYQDCINILNASGITTKAGFNIPINPDKSLENTSNILENILKSSGESLTKEDIVNTIDNNKDLFNNIPKETLDGVINDKSVVAYKGDNILNNTNIPVPPFHNELELDIEQFNQNTSFMKYEDREAILDRIGKAFQNKEMVDYILNDCKSTKRFRIINAYGPKGFILTAPTTDGESIRMIFTDSKCSITKDKF